MPYPKSSLLNSYLHLHFLVVLWGFTAILGKLISIPSIEIVFYRTFFASIPLFLIVRFRGYSLGVGRKNFMSIFGTGAIIAAHWILFFMSARVSNISICLAGLATTSVWTSLLEPMVLRQKIKVYQPILGVVALVGISVVFEAVIDQYVGFLIAVVSAILSAVFTVITRQLVKKSDHYVISFYQMLGASFFAFVFLCFNSYVITANSPQLGLTQSDLIYLIILSLACTVYAHSSLIKLMHKLSAFAINLTINLEPVYGIVLAFLIFGNAEDMGTAFYWGTSIILFSVLLYPLILYYTKKKTRTSIL